MSDDWRCFVGVPIGEELRDVLVEYVARLRRPPEARSLRWSEPDGWHLTLVFLGLVERRSVRASLTAVRRVARDHHAFSVGTGGIGAFPSPRDMRVLWYGVNDRGGRLAALSAELSTALQLEPGRFSPHLTLARSRDGRRGVVSMATIAAPAGETPVGSMRIDRLELYRSHLGDGPARYEVLGRAALQPGGAAA